MLLKCIRCGNGELNATAQAWNCPACAATYPIVDGVARFVTSEHYAESFGYQWNTFAQAQLDSANGTKRSRDMFVEKTGIPLASLAGARVLDAGCGMGRFAEVCIEAGAEVHAIDLSTAVEAAARNLGHRPNASFYQADILQLPFKDGSFDIIYSIGVLHHTPSTKQAFLALTRLLRPGGRIAIWVYSTKLRRLIGGEVMRVVTSRLPKDLLLQACRVAIPLYHLHRLPVVGLVSSALVPTSMNPDPQWRWLDTFDWYSPRYQWKHTYAEVEGWFREAGLTDIVRESFPVSVRGSRAARA